MKSESDKGKPHRKGRPYAVAYLIMWGLVMILAYATKVTDGSSLALNLLVGATIALLSVLPIWAAILVWHLTKAYNKKSVTKAEEPVLEESGAAPAQGNRATQTSYERWKFYKDQESVEFRAKMKALDDKMKSTAQAAQIEAKCKREEERQRQEEAAKEAKRLEARRKWEERRQKELEEERQQKLQRKENNIKLEQAAERGRRNIHAARVEFVQNQEKTAEDIAEQERQKRAVQFSSMSHNELLLEAGKFAAAHVFVSAEALSDWLAGVDTSEIEVLLGQLKDYGLIEETADHKKFWSSLNEDEFLAQLKQKMSAPAIEPSMSVRVNSEMDGFQFEHYCANLLLQNGFQKAEVTQASGDYGIDIKAEKDGVTYGIQCKYYTDKVGNHAVQEAYSGAQFYHCMVAAVMTNCTFTQHAKETAAANNVLLWDKDKLAEFEAAAQDKRLEGT